jgi:hypothetical protein
MDFLICKITEHRYLHHRPPLPPPPTTAIFLVPLSPESSISLASFFLHLTAPHHHYFNFTVIFP